MSSNGQLLLSSPRAPAGPLGVRESPEHVLPICLGTESPAGTPLNLDLAAMTHLLIAGQPGSGKTVAVFKILSDLVTSRSPDDVRLVLIDPKNGVDLGRIEVPHLLYPVVDDVRAAPPLLEAIVAEMDERYRTLRTHRHRDLLSARRHSVTIPFLVVVVEEFTDLLLAGQRAATDGLIRLAQKGRAAGVILITVTHRPAADTLRQHLALLRANVPSRLCFRVPSAGHSRVALDAEGAEDLTNPGDFLLRTPAREGMIHGRTTFIGEREIDRLVAQARRRYAGLAVPLRPLPEPPEVVVPRTGGRTKNSQRSGRTLRRVGRALGALMGRTFRFAGIVTNSGLTAIEWALVSITRALDRKLRAQRHRTRRQRR